MNTNLKSAKQSATRAADASIDAVLNTRLDDAAYRAAVAKANKKFRVALSFAAKIRRSA